MSDVGSDVGSDGEGRFGVGERLLARSVVFFKPSFIIFIIVGRLEGEDFVEPSFVESSFVEFSAERVPRVSPVLKAEVKEEE